MTPTQPQLEPQAEGGASPLDAQIKAIDVILGHVPGQ